jgi:hypothetical protein
MFWQHRVNRSPRRSQQDVVTGDDESPEDSAASGGCRTQMRSDEVATLVQYIATAGAVTRLAFPLLFRHWLIISFSNDFV